MWQPCPPPWVPIIYGLANNYNGNTKPMKSTARKGIISPLFSAIVQKSLKFYCIRRNFVTLWLWENAGKAPAAEATTAVISLFFSASRLDLANGKLWLTATATFCCYFGFPRRSYCCCCFCVSACICNYASWVLESAIEIETTTATRQGNKFSRMEGKLGEGDALKENTNQNLKW